jgi:hypothetical protein
MLRFVIRRKMLDRGSSLASEGLETVDAECPELERVLLGGGTGMDSYDHREIVGAEVLPSSERGFTASQLAEACISAEIPDSKFESLMLALRA